MCCRVVCSKLEHPVQSLDYNLQKLRKDLVLILFQPSNGDLFFFRSVLTQALNFALSAYF